QADAAVLLVDDHFEVRVGLEDGLGVVAVRAGVADRQRALAEQGVDAVGAGLAQLLHFASGEDVQAAIGSYRGVDLVAYQSHLGFRVGRRERAGMTTRGEGLSVIRSRRRCEVATAAWSPQRGRPRLFQMARLGSAWLRV